MSDKPEFEKAEGVPTPDNRFPGNSSRRKPSTTGPLVKLGAIILVGGAAGFLLARDKNAAKSSEPSYTGPTTRTLFGLTLAKKTPPRATFSLLSGGKEYREAAYSASVDPEENSGVPSNPKAGLLYALSGPNPSRLSVNMEVAEPTPAELAAGKATRADKEAKNSSQSKTSAPEYGSKMASAMNASQGGKGALARSYQAQGQGMGSPAAAGASRAASAGGRGAARAQAPAGTAPSYNGSSASSYQSQGYTGAPASANQAYQQPASGASNSQSFTGGQSSSFQSQNYNLGPSVMPVAPAGSSDDSAFMREMMDFVANRFSAYIPTLAAPVAGNPIGRTMAAAIPRNSGGSNNSGGGADMARMAALQNESRLANGRAAAAEQAASQAYTKMTAMAEESKLAAARAAEADQKAKQAEEAARLAQDAARKAEQDASTSAAGKLAAEQRARDAEDAAKTARQEAQDALAAKIAAEKRATVAEEAATTAANERDTAKTLAAKLQTDLTTATNSNAKLLIDLDTQKTKASDALLAQQTAETNAADALAAQQTAETSAAEALAAQQNAETNAANALTAQQNAETNAANALAAQQNAETNAANALAAQQNAETNAANALAAQQNAETNAANALAAQQTAEANNATLSKQLSDTQAQLAAAQGDTTAMRGQLDSIYDAAKASGGVVISSDTTMMPLGTMMTQVRNECTSLKDAMETAVTSLEDNTAILTNQINCSLGRGDCQRNMTNLLSSEDELCNVDKNNIFDNTVASIMTALDQMQTNLQRAQDLSCDMNLFSNSGTGGWECGIISPAKNSIFPIVNWINAKCSILRPKRILEKTYPLDSDYMAYDLHTTGVKINNTQAYLSDYNILDSKWGDESFRAKKKELTDLLEKEEGLSLWNFKRSLAGSDDADDSLPSRRDRWAKMLNSNSACNYEQQDAELVEQANTLGTCDEIKTHNEAVCTEYANNSEFNKDDLATLTVYTGEDLTYARNVIDDCDWFGCSADVEAQLPSARELVRAKAREGCISTYASSCPTVEE